MAEQSSQEKTEHATPRRLREARKKGQIPKSRDISTILVLIIAFIVICMTLSYMGGEFKKIFQLSFEVMSQNVITGGALWELGKAATFTFVKVLAPIFIAGVAIAFLAGMAQAGGIFSAEPLKPKLEKINPLEGIKNMFKVIALVELVKNIIKLALVFYLAYSTIAKSIDEVLATARVDILLSARLAGGIIFEFVVKVCIAFIFISLLDYAAQRWNFMKNMRMTKDEVKREYKQDEGDPAIKGERRRLHREMAFGDVKQAVKKSDVVVSNPVHVACALEYKKAEMGAPTLTMKGQRRFAEMILQVAREENIPIVRNIPLAWSLVHLEIGDEVPEQIYEAVAEVLATVYEMKQAERHKLATETEQPNYI